MLTVEPLAPSLQTQAAVCCLCGPGSVDAVARGVDFEYGVSDDQWTMERCRGCGLLILNPRPVDEELVRVYPPHYHAFAFDGEKFGFVHRVRQWLESRRLLALFRYLPASAKILDIGCGDGFHLKLLRQFGPPGWQLEGIEPNAKAADRARRSGLNIHCGTLEDAELPPSSCDAALLIMTLEHLNDPAAALHQIQSLLKPGGRLVIVTDNSRSLDARFFRSRHWGGYHFPRHTYLFDRSSLTRLGQKLGFEVLRIRTIVSPVNWVYSIRNWLQDRGAPKWLVNQWSLTKPIPLVAFTLLDHALRLFGRGALLQAVFQRPVEGEKS